ncbi:MAG: N-formylglutamate amidohydrolase [Cypionkella sp.]
MADSFRILHPARQTSAVVFASPHSGRDYSAAFLDQSLLGADAIRTSEDAFVDQLFADAPRFGAPLMLADVPRAFLDLNRAPDELDPAVIAGAPRLAHNPRVASGLGVIPRVVAGGRPIYSGKLSLAEADDRLTRHWHPYHAALRGLLDDTHARFGEVTLIDCHSMPHEAIEGHSRNGQRHPEVVLGDRFGASANREVTDHIEAAFAAAGLRVARNTPFAGAFIAQSYGRPVARRHVVQVEIDRRLYMDEATITPRADFEAFRSLINGVMAELTGGKALQMAAE